MNQFRRKIELLRNLKDDKLKRRRMRSRSNVRFDYQHISNLFDR